MADDFIGLHMLVSLRDQPVQFKGTVSAIEAGPSSRLTLSNVRRLDNNQFFPSLTLDASTILDLHQVPSTPPAEVITPVVAEAPVPHALTPTQSTFSDPAIISLGKKPVTQAQQLPSAPLPKRITIQKRDPHPTTAAQSLPRLSSQQVPVSAAASIPISALAEAVGGLSIHHQPVAPAIPSVNNKVSEAGGQPGEELAPKRRQRRRRAKNGAAEEAPEGLVLPNKQGKGWRQTPMLENTQAFQPFTSLRRNGTRGRRMDENGWASEDVTDVQEAGEFDFEDGIRKFDKSNLFEQMRKDDQIDDADRLVSHNRLPRPKPGTNGGKNLHATENVLDIPSPKAKSVLDRTGKETANDFWTSEADDSVVRVGERLSGREQGSRQSLRRGESKISTNRRSQSRKASGVAPGPGSARAMSVVNNQQFANKTSRPSSRLSAQVSDKKAKTTGNSSSPTQGLYLQPSNRKVETVSAFQMLSLENIAYTELGLTEEMMTENAGRGIAEVTLAALNDPAIKVRLAASASSATKNSPTVVILAGNNKSSVRAVSAGRHLLNKGVDVLVCLVGMERSNHERDLLEDLRQQIRLFRSFGGRLYSKRDLFEFIRKASIPTLTIDTPRTAALSSLAAPSPVTLIIDALLGLALSFDDLSTGDQTTCYELIEWANRNEAFVLAIDVPTGIDPTSGEASVTDGNQLYVKPRYVVCMGAPKRGLLEAMIACEQDSGDAASGNPALVDDAPTEWKLYLVDIGFGQAVWKKAGAKTRRGIDLGHQWVVEMRYRGVVTGEDDDDDMPV